MGGGRKGESSPGEITPHPALSWALVTYYAISWNHSSVRGRLFLFNE